jgi:hypothetical protein
MVKEARLLESPEIAPVMPSKVLSGDQGSLDSVYKDNILITGASGRFRLHAARVPEQATSLIGR